MDFVDKGWGRLWMFAQMCKKIGDKLRISVRRRDGGKAVSGILWTGVKN